MSLVTRLADLLSVLLVRMRSVRILVLDDRMVEENCRLIPRLDEMCGDTRVSSVHELVYHALDLYKLAIDLGREGRILASMSLDGKGIEEIHMRPLDYVVDNARPDYRT